MFHAIAIRGEAPVARQFRAPQHALAKLREMTIRSHADREGPVAAVENLIGNDGGMSVAVLLRFISRDEHILGDVDQRGDRRAEQRDLQ